MQVNVHSPLFDRGDSDWKLPERGPILPSDVTHQAPVRGDLVKSAQHNLLRLFDRDIEFCAADSRAKARKQRTKIREMGPKAELVVDRRLIGQPDPKFSDRPEQNADIAAERLIPRF